MCPARTALVALAAALAAGCSPTATPWDVAGDLATLPRRDFAKQHLDWSRGQKPPDASC